MIVIEKFDVPSEVPIFFVQCEIIIDSVPNEMSATAPTSLRSRVAARVMSIVHH